MKIWFNKIHDSRRSMVEIEDDQISIGRDASNKLVLKSPLVSKKQAIIERSNGKLKLTNVGINSCMVGDNEVLGGEEREFTIGETVRIWPYTVNFEVEEAAPISRHQLEAHLRSLMSDLDARFEIFAQLRSLLGSKDGYWMEFDVAQDGQFMTGSLADDLTDIYCELKHGLGVVDEEPRRAFDGWRSGYRVHWGQHLVDAERHLYELRSRNQF